MLSFHTIFVIDLHGNAKKKENSPDGTKDENVFDIEQGVAISFFIKNKNSDPGVFHAELWGTRQGKYRRHSSERLTYPILAKTGT